MLHLLGLSLCLCLLAVAQWELAVRSVTIIRVALGLDNDYKSANVYARHRQWAALLFYSAAGALPAMVVIFWFAVCGVFIALAQRLPVSQIIQFFFFAIIGLVFTCTVSWSLLGSSLAFTVLSSEDKSLSVICVRTYELMKNYMWRGGSFVILLTVTLFAVTGALDLPIFVASLFDAWRNGITAGYEMPLYMEVLSAFVDSIINILLLSIAPIANALYYNDLRMRVEGRDILMRLEKLEG